MSTGNRRQMDLAISFVNKCHRQSYQATSENLRKCDYWADRQMDRQTADQVIPMCCYAVQATQKREKKTAYNWILLINQLNK